MSSLIHPRTRVLLGRAIQILIERFIFDTDVPSVEVLREEIIQTFENFAKSQHGMFSKPPPRYSRVERTGRSERSTP